MSDRFPLPKANPAVSEFLRTRRSNLARNMTGPGPDEAELREILTTAARVPDHRKLAPWRFVVIQGEARERLGEVLRERSAEVHADKTEKVHQMDGERFLRAPVVVAVVSSPVDCVKGTPEWEQVLSAGAVCLKMCMAAQAKGFAAQWLTEWYAYDAPFLKALGLGEREKVAGFIYMGTTEEASMERPRPEIGDIVSYA